MNRRIWLAVALAVRITGNAPGMAATAAAPPASTTNSPAKPGRTFEVKGYHIEGNTVLPPEKFGFLTNYTGTAVEMARLREGLNDLQMLYRNLGYATISVTLPQQRLTNGIVRVDIVEGKLSEILIQGNRYFSSNNIRRALPSVTTNVLINTKWFQPELDRANANTDRQIYPVLNPGYEPGSTELTLKVKDRLPLHGHIELNDRSTLNTPLLRVDAAAQYNNLWQRDHQIGFEYNFSPEAYKTQGSQAVPFDNPMVASYSGFYRIPIASGGLRDVYESTPVDFGYDQVTHQFRLPPATGQPELVFFASRSASDTLPVFGPLKVITNTVLADISSQFAQRQSTINNDVGAKFTVPVREFDAIKSSVTLGIDYKTYSVQTLSTNLTYFDLFALDNFGNRVLVTNHTIALPANSANSLRYLPLSIGWFASRSDPSGSFSFNLNQNVFLSALASDRIHFEQAAGSSLAGGNYSTINAGLSREQRLPNDWSSLMRIAGQWSSAPLISNEQFALGGSGGVRGYREGETYGDSGWRTQLDIRAPALNVGYFPLRNEDIPASLRCSWFMDYGEAYHSDGASFPTIKQWGTGLGFYYTAGQHFDARLTLGWALHDTPLTKTGTLEAYFSVGLQF